MTNRRLLVCAAFATVGAGVLGLALAQPQHAQAGSAAPPLAVRAVTVGMADPAGDGSGARYAATIRYDHEATLSFRLPGRITSLPLRAGDVVAAGALVAAIEPDAYAAAAAMRAADAARTRRDADRIAGLVADGATSPAAAAAAQDAARSASAGLNAAQYDLASTRLRAPFAALVLARQAEAGETVAAGAPLVRVADRASPLLAVADVPADMAARLTRGTLAQVWPAGATAPLTATVWRVAGGADAKSGLVAVQVRLTAPIRLASGSPAAVGFASAPASTAATGPRQRIPAEALIDASANSADVWLIDGGGRAQRHTLRFYGFDDRDALVGGLPAGARVITTGAGFVAPGQQVAVIGE
ncbi:efflux RND transporter periplasmic adaptor subunit [Novosphingobium sp.]|uniref:efflux RND transporter periplasmic adaptor subunit n=1 Tax=Novosphingobium sp. TaxID=1874826 RepID=UPI00333E3180